MGTQHDSIVSALNKTVEIFTSHSGKTFDEVVSSGLQHIADAAGLNRVAIYRVLDKVSGKIGQIYLWAYGKTIPLDAELVELPKVPPVLRWLEKLKKGECVHGNAADMDKDQAEFCALFGVKAILFTPIFTHGEFWGVITLEDHTTYRYFDEDCVELMQAASRICANAFIRNEMAKNTAVIMRTLHRREEMTGTITQMAMKFLSQSEENFDDMMNAGIKPLIDIMKLDRFSIWRNFNKADVLHTSQIYRWDRVSGGTTPPTPSLVDVTYAQLAPRWEESLAVNNEINGPASMLPAQEAAMLKSFGIKSAFITPIFINNNFWGFVLFEDREEERYFDRDSIEMMRSAAFLCVNTIIRADMEREIEDANEFNRAALKVSPVGFLVIDDQLRFVDCNDTLINMVKPASKQELLDNFALFSPKFQKDGRRSIDVIHDVHRRALEGETLVFEWEHLSSSGELIPCEITLTRTPYKEKYILFAYQYDLRNIKRMENAVLAANEFNQATINAMPIGFYIFDEQYKVIECNDTIPTMFDITKEQFIYNVNNGLFSPEYQPDGVKSSDRVADMLQRAFNGEKPRFEWMHQADGSDKIVTFEINLLRTIYNEKPVVLCFQYNISNIKEMEKSIREQSEMLKSRLEQQELISEISRGFISSGDSETFIKEAIAKLGHYHDVSSVFIFQIDYKKKSAFPAYHWSDDGSPARLVNFDFFSVIKNSFPERLPECATLPVLFTEDIASSSDGTNKPLLQVDVNAFIVAPLYVEGRLWGVVSVEQHFTPRKWTENEKTFVAVTAGTIAGVIMRNIYTTMLKDALDKATMASKAKGEFLSNMSHEMRTPLNAIIGMTAIAKNAVDVERKNYALNKIEDASAHLLGVINDVLDMSKIEANKLELSSVEFSFERMLQKTVTVINFRVEEKHQKLTVHIDRAIPEYLVGDDQRLTQVITNLLGNAVKFTPDKGTISLDARFIKEENGLCTIQVSVADSGIGITKEQKARLFQSFHQAEASTVRKYGGTGLGLAISKNIVTMMGGKIWVESEKDKGSTFYFTIQAKRGEGKTKSLRERSEKWESIRILAVDDDPDILDFFKDISNRYGVYCDTALSGDDALRMVERNGDYNVYFIDWKMPGIDGITLTGALKTIERNTGNSVVIMISAAEWTSIEDEARKAGVEKFLSKPLFPSAVADTICECLGIERHKTDKEKAEVSPDSFKGHRILLVEDVEINREIVLTILEPMGLEIECAENGIQSVDMFRDAPEKYEMIFMDVQMPEMDGYDATRCIRAMEKEWKDTGERSSHVPIVAMTANVFKEDIEKCLDAGMDDHIGKPLDFEVVLEKLNAFLK